MKNETISVNTNIKLLSTYEKVLVNGGWKPDMNMVEAIEKEAMKDKPNTNVAPEPTLNEQLCTNVCSMTQPIYGNSNYTITINGNNGVSMGFNCTCK
jgi:hypothetical protein